MLVSLRLASLLLFTTLNKLRQNKRKTSLPEVAYKVPADRTSAPPDNPAFGFGASAHTLMKEKTTGRKACQQSRVHDAHCTCAVSNPLDKHLSTVLSEVVWGDPRINRSVHNTLAHP